MTKRIRKLTFIWLAAVLAFPLMIGTLARTVGPFSSAARDVTGHIEVFLLVLGTPLVILWVIYFLRWTWVVTKPGRKDGF
jgi:hypothetical protein